MAFSQKLEGFFSHPILWGILALIALAVALTGRLSVSAASYVMWFAWVLAVFGVYRVFTQHQIDPLLKVLSLAGIACILSVGVIVANRWFNTKPHDVTAVPALPPAPRTGDPDSGLRQTRTHGHAQHPKSLQAPDEVRSSETENLSPHPRLVDGPEPYKNFTNAQIGQLAIDESDRIFNLATSASNRAWEMRQPPNNPQIALYIDKDFSDQFAECCAEDLAAIRAEILKRLPAANKLVDETRFYNIAMNMISSDDRRGRYRSDLLNAYVPKLRLMGEVVKRSSKSRAVARSVGFSAERVPPEIMPPAGFTKYWTKITIGDDTPIGIGYLVIEGSPRVDLHTSSRIESPLEGLPQPEEITNPEFVRFVAGHPNALALQIGEGSVSRTHPASVYLATTTELGVEKITFYDR